MKKKVSTIIVLDGKKFLILQRSKTSTSPNKWNFPGGGIDDGESPEIAAVRELKEEADLDVSIKNIDSIGKLETESLVVNFFITSKFSGDVSINKESQNYKWVTLGEIDKYNFVGKGGQLHPDLIIQIGKYILDQK